MKDEALKLALEMLEELNVAPQDYDFGPAYEGAKQRRKKAITAVKEALAAPVAEDVVEAYCKAWGESFRQANRFDVVSPMSDDLKKHIRAGLESAFAATHQQGLQVATPPAAPVQEPVAWFKHGPYEDGEPLAVVFENPHDDVCYSPLGFIETPPAAQPAPVQEPHPTVYVYRLESGGTQVMAPNIHDPALVINMLEQALVAMSDEGRPITRN